ncbi:uncharacterized protein [Dermacentor albipictus]|uniref:uncharacterized protein isoform X2 n=1 Tax=Dermacentor albipictus TaxID=60249 RepID=UPI0038FCD611
MCLCDTPMTVMILGIACLISNVSSALTELAGLLQLGTGSTVVNIRLVVSGIYCFLACLLSLGLILAANSSNRALMEKVVCGIKIKVAGFVISMILSIYLISTIDVDALVEAYEKELAKNDKKPRMGNDSWGPKYLPGPMYLALAPKKSDEKDKDEPSDKKSSAETAKAALIYGSLMYLIFWTGFDTANIRRQFASAVTSTSRAQEGHAVSAAPFPTSTKGHKLALYIQKNQDHVVSLIRFAGC